jgi:hypothetical protein
MISQPRNQHPQIHLRAMHKGIGGRAVAARIGCSAMEIKKDALRPNELTPQTFGDTGTCRQNALRIASTASDCV